MGVSTATSGGAPASSSSYRAMVSRMERARLRVGAGEQRAHGAVPRSAQSGEKLGAGDQAAAQGAVQGDERVQLRCAAHEGEDGGLLVGERRAQRVDGSAGVPVDDDAPDAVYGVLVVGGDNVEPASGALLKGDAVVLHCVRAGDETAQAPGDNGGPFRSRQGDDVLRVADDDSVGHHAAQSATAVF